jgi:hypothetical protein
MFLDELHAHFEGREIKQETNEEQETDQVQEEPEDEEDVNATAVQVITEGQRRGWTEVDHEQEEEQGYMLDNAKKEAGVDALKDSVEPKASLSCQSIQAEAVQNVDGEALEEEDIDGEALDDDDLDGEDLDDDDLDGEALDEKDM